MGSRRPVRDEEVVDLGDVTLVHATAKAILIEMEGEEYWVPLSLVRDGSQVQQMSEGDVGALVVPKWFAEKEHLV